MTMTPTLPLDIIAFGVAANGWDAVLTLITQAIATVIAILLALWIQGREFRAATKDRADIVLREQAAIRDGWRRTTVTDAVNALWAHGDVRLYKTGGNQHATRQALVSAIGRFRLDPEAGGDRAADWFDRQIRILDGMTPHDRDRPDKAIIALRARVRGYVGGVEDALLEWQRGNTNDWLATRTPIPIDSETAPPM